MLEQGLQAGKERLKQLFQQLGALQSKHERLSQEICLLQRTVSWLEEGAAQHRAAGDDWLRGHPLLDDYFIGAAPGLQPCHPWDRHGTHHDAKPVVQQSSLSVKQLLEMLPLSAITSSTCDKFLHRRIMSLTPKAAAAHWNQAVKDLKMLLYVHEHDPISFGHEMVVMVNELLRWSCACYVFNPSVLQQLRDMNLSTMQHQPAPAEHWTHAWEAAHMTEAQLRHITAVRDLSCTKLDALDAEQQQLLEELAQLNAAAAVAPAGGQSLQDRPAGSAGSCSSANKGLIERRRWEVAQQLACVTKTRQVLVQLRSQLVVIILEPVQAARIVCAVYPYMLLGGPLYQHLPSDSADNDAACSACGNGIAGSASSASTTSSSGGNNKHGAMHFWQALSSVCVHPAWRGVARLPQLQHLLQQPAPEMLTRRLASLCQGLTVAAVPGGSSLAAAGLLPGLPYVAAAGLTIPPSLAETIGLTRQSGVVAPPGLTAAPGLITSPSPAAVVELSSLMHHTDYDTAVVGDNYS